MIFLISGTPASGKTSVSRALMQLFERGVHIPVDDLREMVVSGVAHPVPTWTEETTIQFRLARASAAQMALLYVQAGFAVAIDDVISTRDFVSDYAPHLQDASYCRVLLLPDLQRTLQRNFNRTNKNFPPELLENVIDALHHEHSGMDQTGWLVIDSSFLDIDATVQVILEKASAKN